MIYSVYTVAQDYAHIRADDLKVRRAMTLADERFRAVLAAEQLLADLCDSKKTPRVPAAIRRQAGMILRHYPSDYDMSKAAQTSPDIFAERLEDLHRFILQGSLDNGEKP